MDEGNGSGVDQNGNIIKRYLISCVKVIRFNQVIKPNTIQRHADAKLLSV